jgi:sphinganine-1-phosphate aldolase
MASDRALVPRPLQAVLELLAAILRERVRKSPLWSLLATNAASLFLALHLAARRSGGLRALLIRTLLRAARATPLVRGQLVKVKASVREKFERMVAKDIGQTTCELPPDGMSDALLSAQLRQWSGAEMAWRAGKVSGTVYSGDDALTRLMAEAFRLYALSNPMHPDVFPSVRKMEAEIVSMVLRLFHGGHGCCGTMASGGTEAILLACKAHRDEARETRGVLEPEMVVPSTAHAAFLKAGHYLGVRVIRVPVDPVTFQADPRAMARAISRRTILLVASAPSFAQGVIDPVDELAQLARASGVGLHVDCCAGSLLLGLMGKLGYECKPFDFALDGVSSISCDMHTYGFAPKGTAVVLYASEELRCAWPTATACRMRLPPSSPSPSLPLSPPLSLPLPLSLALPLAAPHAPFSATSPLPCPAPSLPFTGTTSTLSPPTGAAGSTPRRRSAAPARARSSRAAGR